MSVNQYLTLDGKFFRCRGSNRDITERKQIEDKFSTRQSFLKMFSDAGFQPMMILESCLGINLRNTCMVWRADEVIGKVFNEIVPIEYPNNDRAKILARFREKGIWQGESSR